jgi:hypothetical protein
MKNTSAPLLTCFFLLLSVFFAVDVSAAPKKKKGANKQSGPKNPMLQSAFGAGFAKAKLSQQQQLGMMKLVQQYSGEAANVRKLFDDVYSDEQKEMISRAQEMAVRAGVKPENVAKRVAEAKATIQLNEAQKRQKKEAEQALAALKKKMKADALKFITPQQAQALFSGI